MKNSQFMTAPIKYCRDSTYSCGTARIKSRCNLPGNHMQSPPFQTLASYRQAKDTAIAEKKQLNHRK